MNPDEDPEQRKPDEPAPQSPPEPPPPVAAAPESPPAEPEPEHEPLYEPPPRFETRRGDSVFGEPEIPMPGARPSMSRKLHARDAQKNLDLDLNRIKRTKRYGIFLTTITVLFVAFVVVPVTWSAVYLFADPPTNVLMLKRAAEGETIRHYPVSIDDMSPHIIRAVIAAEDGNFCTHDGFDVQAIQNAMEANARSQRVRGGSTVSQQTAKNLFLWPERSWIRKGFETYFTGLIEFMWPKERIMEAYLNTAEWGDGNFGIEAAARARFNTSAKDLTPRQAAVLAAVLPSPNRWRADSPGPYVRGRAATIAQRAGVVRNEHLAACVLALDRPRERR